MFFFLSAWHTYFEMMPQPFRRILALLTASALLLAGPVPAFALRAGLEGTTQGELAREISSPPAARSTTGLEEDKVHVNWSSARQIKKHLDRLPALRSLGNEQRSQLAQEIVRQRTLWNPYRNADDFIERLQDIVPSVSLTKLHSVKNSLDFTFTRRAFLTTVASGTLGLGLISYGIKRGVKRREYGTDSAIQFTLNEFEVFDRSRRAARPATRKIIEEIITTYLGENDSIMEVGSGDGELARLMSDRLRSRLVQSDLDPRILAANRFDTPKKVIDIYDMSLEDNTVPGIVSIEVFDAIHDLQKALREIRRVLKPGGVTIGFFDSQPSHTMTMARFPEDVLFPARHLQAYTKVNRRELLQRIRQSSSVVDSESLALLRQYIQAPAAEWLRILRMPETEQLERLLRLHMALSFTLRLPTETFDAVTEFQEHLGKSLRETGFQVVRTEPITAEVELDRATLPILPSEHNVLQYHKGHYEYRRDPAIPPDRAKIKSTVYVVVARKPAAGMEEGTLPVAWEAGGFKVPVTAADRAARPMTRSDEELGNTQIRFYQGLTSGESGMAAPSLIEAGHAQPGQQRAVIEDATTAPQVVRMFYHSDVMPPSAAGVTAIPLPADAEAARVQLAAADLTPRDVILLPDTIAAGLEDQWRPTAGTRTPILIVPVATLLAADDLNLLAAIALALDGRLLRVRPETILRTGLEDRTVFSTQY
ncbi:MAG: class I SAM-dependent methyltransferase [Candidatus Omnitrophica bacterium]|nr:class I SAM-dependent methyltransferase [Candidatus Omnitrophota bacterium]